MKPGKVFGRSIAVIFLFAGVFALGYFTDRSITWHWAVPFGVAFIGYFMMLTQGWRAGPVLLFALALRIVLLTAQPTLTDDHYRYILDGYVTVYGGERSVYMHTPADLAARGFVPATDLLDRLNHDDTFTVYPPVAQWLFAAAAWIGGLDEGHPRVERAVIALRSMIILAEILTLWMLVLALRRMRVPEGTVAWYALNPLVIIELTGNLHTEVFMICFTVTAILLFFQRWRDLSAVMLGVAAAAKLWPLFFLLALPSQLSIGRTIRYVIIVLVVFLITWVPFFRLGMFEHFLESLRLYFSYFEFNASIYEWAKWLLPEKWVKGGPAMIIGTIAAWSVLYWSMLRSRRTSLAEGMLWTLGIYFAFASTVHPWYILPLLALAVLTPYRWPFIWSLLIVPTYLTYTTVPYSQPYGWIGVEYVILIGIIALEWMIHSYNGMMARAQMKFDRLVPMIPRGARILDVGTGNGALAYLLHERGQAITTIDVVDKCRFPKVRPQVITNDRFPFRDDHFDLVLLITMLHHTRDQEQLLLEARRVGQKVIVMEDIYQSMAQRTFTMLFDSLINLEFIGHPHTNREDAGWRHLFNRLDMKVDEAQTYRFLALFLQVTYVLAKSDHKADAT